MTNHFTTKATLAKLQRSAAAPTNKNGLTDRQPLNGALRFYTGLASDYTEQFADWQLEVLAQGRVLKGLFEREGVGASVSVLDCACGVGTQAIGLAQHGFRVVGTDLCPDAVARARSNADLLAPGVEFHVSAFADLTERLQEHFDVICCCDNALPHLLEDDQILDALSAMRSRLVDNGLLVLSIRDYDNALRQRVKGTVPRMFDTANGRRIVFQVWQWQTPRVYKLQHFLMLAEPNGWRTTQHTVHYRALTRRELTRLLHDAGFNVVKWYMPQDSGYHQPIVTARVTV